MTAYDPLSRSAVEPSVPADLDGELRLAREVLAEVAAANIHDHDAMLKAASGLNYRMRSLLAAIEAERGSR